MYRSRDFSFMNEASKRWNTLLPKLEPLLRKNGGPILMAQIEHYYRLTRICDRLYILDLANLAKKYIVNDIVLYSVDVSIMPFMRCGLVPGILSTNEMQPNSDANAITLLAQVDHESVRNPYFATTGFGQASERFVHRKNHFENTASKPFFYPRNFCKKEPTQYLFMSSKAPPTLVINPVAL
ncbi:hypothetical protein L5515_018110 [Caenorhabditis briggsae]|uniref:Glycoside hydrolase 35 catalytic domain-containing protein n=1 Tax=Caenorhabditis briggsae TaxID=6238 RepID=A0AAE9FH71_CAEBR|nr:hypothetical protein L5515_018110 [Caenorhabditis briggsae]